MTKGNLTCLIAVGMLLVALAVYATVPKMVHHTFEFGMLDPNQDVEVLDYRYGNAKATIVQPDKEYLAAGHIPQANDESTFSRPGDSLYVKWRVISTGKVYEDTVDLKSRLTSDMNEKTIHFAIKGSQLYVYLIEGITSKQVHAKDASDCPPKVYRPFKCTRIYPDHWKNF